MLVVLWESLGFLQTRLAEQIDLSNKMFITQLRDYAVKEAVLTNDFADLQYQLQNIPDDSGIEDIVVLDSESIVVAAHQIKDLGRAFDQILTSGNWHADTIDSASGNLGRVAYKINSGYSQRATAGALGFGITLALTGMLVIAAVGIIIGTLLSRRLEKITSSLSAIRDGMVDSYEVDQSKDEVGQLSRFIYDMGKTISSRMNELIDLEEYTRFALQSAGAGAWSYDLVDKRLRWSAKNFQLLGYAPNKNRPSFRLWRSLLHPEDFQHVDHAVNQLLNQHNDLDIEYRIIRPSGEVRWMRSVGRVYFDSDMQPKEAYGLQIDISRYKNIEYDLWGQIFLLKKMLSISGECIITLGARNDILLCNASTLFLFGYGKGELFGREFSQLVAENEREQVVEILSRDVNSSDQIDQRGLAFTALSKNGQTMSLLLKFEKYRDEDKFQRTTLLIGTNTEKNIQSKHKLTNESTIP